jgi:hypothetical protein
MAITTSNSIKVNALGKLHFAFERVNSPAIASDTGNEPGIKQLQTVLASEGRDFFLF